MSRICRTTCARAATIVGCITIEMLHSKWKSVGRRSGWGGRARLIHRKTLSVIVWAGEPKNVRRWRRPLGTTRSGNSRTSGADGQVVGSGCGGQGGGSVGVPDGSGRSYGSLALGRQALDARQETLEFHVKLVERLHEQEIGHGGAQCDCFLAEHVVEQHRPARWSRVCRRRSRVRWRTRIWRRRSVSVQSAATAVVVVVVVVVRFGVVAQLFRIHGVSGDDNRWRTKRDGRRRRCRVCGDLNGGRPSGPGNSAGSSLRDLDARTQVSVQVVFKRWRRATDVEAASWERVSESPGVRVDYLMRVADGRLSLPSLW